MIKIFKFLKEKLKKAVGSVSKKVEEEVVEVPQEVKEEIKKEKPEKQVEKEKKSEVSDQKKTKEEKRAEKEELKKKKKQEKDKKKEEKLKQEEEKKQPAEESKEEKISEEFKEEKKELEKEDIEEKEKLTEEFVEEKKSDEKRQVEEEKDKKEEQEQIFEEEKSEKRGFFSKLKGAITEKTLSQEKFEDIFFDLEVALMENNIALKVIEKIKEDLKTELVDKKIPIGKIEKKITETLQHSIEELFDIEKVDLVELIKQKKEKPFVVVFVGVNGSGKTTNLAKVANLFHKKGISTVIAAADTFRMAAIEQIEKHANALGTKIIKHDYGSDAAAVVFDAIKHAQANKKDAVLVDTAGRSHSNVNLMDELKKVIRIAKPDFTIFVGDSLTGNDVIEQIQTFNQAVNINGIILSKVDVDEKGGAAISCSYVTEKPILYLGVGQEYGDLMPFDKEKIMGTLNFID